MKTTKTLLMIALFVVGAVAAPALAQGGPESRPDRDDRPEQADRNQTRGPDHNQSRGPDNVTRGPDDNRSRGPPAHAMERIEARCDAAENKTGQRPAACDRLAEIHSGEHQARRAAHAGMQALDAWEHLNSTLAMLKQKFEAKLAQENLTANQTAAYEDKLERIEAMQESLAERRAAMEERIAGLQERHQAVREHVAERREARGEGGRPAFAGGDDADSDDASSDDADEAADADSDDAETGGNETVE